MSVEVSFTDLRDPLGLIDLMLTRHELAVVNVGCCQQCFDKHGSFADASWAMGEFMRKVFAPVAA
jgi:hypothetical protein